MIRLLWLALFFVPLSSWAKLCPDGQFEINKTGLAECVDTCPVGYFDMVTPTGTAMCKSACPAQQQRTMSWDPRIDGEDPKGFCYKPDNNTKPFEYGVYGCDMTLYLGILCYASGDSCQAKFRNTGELCTVEGPHGSTIPNPDPDPDPDPNPNPNPNPDPNLSWDDPNFYVPPPSEPFDKYGCFSTSHDVVSAKCFATNYSHIKENSKYAYHNVGISSLINRNGKETNKNLKNIENIIKDMDLSLSPQDRQSNVDRNKSLNDIFSQLQTLNSNSGGDGGSNGSDVDLSTTERLLDFMNNNLSNISRSASGAHHFSAQIADNVRKLEIRSRDSGSGGGTGGDADLSDVNYNLDIMVDLTQEIQRSTAATRSLANLQVGETVNGLASVKESIDGLFANSPEPHTPDSGVKFGDDYLYSKEVFNELNSDVDVLKQDYKNELEKFKSYFQFSETLNNGEYKERTLDLIVNNQEVNYKITVLENMLLFKETIAAIVMFGFTLAGIGLIARS